MRSRHQQRAGDNARQRDHAHAPDLVKALRTLNFIISSDWAIDLLRAYSLEALARAPCSLRMVCGWQDTKNAQALLRPSWVGLNTRLAAAAFANMNIALAVFPFIAAAFRPASAGAASALQDSYGWAVRVLGVLLVQWVVVPLLFARQEASIRSRSRNAVIDLSAVRAAAHALFTAVTFYLCPLKMELVSYVLFSSLQRHCCVFIPVFAHDVLSYWLWNSLSAAVLHICTLKFSQVLSGGLFCPLGLF